MSKLLVVLSIIILSLAIPAQVQSQSVLMISKRGKTLAQYSAGEELRFKLKDEKYYHEAMITGFSQDKVHFHYFEVAFDEIETIDLGDKKKSWLRMVSALTIRAGAVFLFLDVFNQGVITRDGFEPAPQTLMISGGLIGISLLTNLLNRKRLPVSKPRFELKTL